MICMEGLRQDMLLQEAVKAEQPLSWVPQNVGPAVLTLNIKPAVLHPRPRLWVAWSRREAMTALQKSGLQLCWRRNSSREPAGWMSLQAPGGFSGLRLKIFLYLPKHFQVVWVLLLQIELLYFRQPEQLLSAEKSYPLFTVLHFLTLCFVNKSSCRQYFDWSEAWCKNSCFSISYTQVQSVWHKWMCRCYLCSTTYC